MESSRARAQQRASWPVRRFALGHEPGPNLEATTTAQERLAMMWPLAIEAWSLGGRPLPAYLRSESPIRRLSLGDDRTD
jgi:hypothetical protein